MGNATLLTGGGKKPLPKKGVAFRLSERRSLRLVNELGILPNRRCNFAGLTRLLCMGGWGLATVMFFLICPLLYQRMIVKLPPVQKSEWIQTLDTKKAELTRTLWKDARPLNILIGDSQIELGDWYGLFGGAYAVRNCGLSRAKIQDVTTLVKAVPERNPETVILMCGINNINYNDSVSSCITKFNTLLLTTRAVITPRRIIVLSVMPLRQSALDKNSSNTNKIVVVFNQELQNLCKLYNATFIDINQSITDARGGLSSEVTVDGLHLNKQGYQNIAPLIAAAIATH
jgi:hypothetical protein